MKYKLTIIIAVVLVIIGLAAWYFYSSPTTQMPYSPGGTSLGSGNTITDIANDFNRLPSDSSTTQEMDALNKNIQNF